jgi:hypothetical protein
MISKNSQERYSVKCIAGQNLILLMEVGFHLADQISVLETLEDTFEEKCNHFSNLNVPG